MLSALVAGVFAAVLLQTFYSSVGQQWPQSYSSARTALHSFVRASLFKYLLFRTVPVYLMAVLTAATTARLKGYPVAALSVFLLTHLTASNGLGWARLVFGTTRVSRRAALIGLHVLVIVLALITVIAAAATYRALLGFVPRPRELVSSLWTAVFAAVAAFGAQRLVAISRATQISEYDRAREDIGTNLWSYVEVAAANHDCDPEVVRAIIAAEVNQRPAWFRRLERLKGRLQPQGSYGVAQVQAPKPISDEESIDRLCQRLQGYFPERTSGGYVIASLFEARLEEHNADPVFVRLAAEMLQKTIPYPRAHSEVKGHDRRPTVEVSTVERRGTTWWLKGTASVDNGQLLALCERNSGDSSSQVVRVNKSAPLRGRWELDIPLNPCVVTLTDQLDPPAEQRSARVDLTQT